MKETMPTERTATIDYKKENISSENFATKKKEYCTKKFLIIIFSIVVAILVSSLCISLTYPISHETLKIIIAAQKIEIDAQKFTIDILKTTIDAQKFTIDKLNSTINNFVQTKIEKINKNDFYKEYSGHQKQHLMTVKNNFDALGNKDGYIYLAGDSSLDNKHWFDTTADAVNGYEHFLDPPLSKCDVCYNVNKLLAEQNKHYACINTAIEATTLAQREDKLLGQDEFIRDHITENDYLIISIGANDIALIPSAETVKQMKNLSKMKSPEEVRNNPNNWGLEHFKSMFKTQMEVYMHKLCEKKKPKKILLCMIYFPAEENVSSWAIGTLEHIGYNTNPEILQTAISIIFEEAIREVKFPDAEVNVIPFPLYSILDGKTTSDYCSRVEPSPSGGEKMANAFLKKLF